MSPFKHFLVPTDFSESSLQAIDVAVSLATTISTELTLMHTWEIPVYPYMEYVLSAAELAASVEQAVERRLQDALELLKQRVPWAKSVLKPGSSQVSQPSRVQATLPLGSQLQVLQPS